MPNFYQGRPQNSSSPVATPRGSGAQNGSRASNAASYITRKSLANSSGYCARYVRKGLQSAGYKFDQQPLAYQYHSTGQMKKMGFTQISESAISNPKRGDVAIYGRSKGHSAGHIQMYDGRQWVSDFRQKTHLPWSNAKSGGLFYYRDMKSQ